MINYELTEHQERIKSEASEFARTVIAPRAEEIDRTGSSKSVMDVWAAMAKEPYQYTGMHTPVEYGGYPRSLLDQVIIAEELAAVGKSPVCSLLLEGLELIAITNHGTEEMKRKYIPPTVRGESKGSFALTEPGTGSDAAELRCRAQRVGDEYIINGRKRYVSYAHEASYIYVYAVTDQSKGPRGISAFLVPTDIPGYKVLERYECIGMRGHEDEEVQFNNCRIPKENLIGEEGKGFSYALEVLDEGRTTLSAGFIGLARACLDEAVVFAKGRVTFGKPLFHRQALSFPLAEIAAQIDAVRLLIYNAAWLHERGKRHTIETAKAKTLAAKVMLDAANMAIEVLGGFGCTKRHVVERLYRDARIWSFAQGATQMMKFIITRDLFGKYEM